MAKRVVKITVIASVDDSLPLWFVARSFFKAVTLLNKMSSKNLASIRSIKVKEHEREAIVAASKRGG